MGVIGGSLRKTFVAVIAVALLGATAARASVEVVDEGPSGVTFRFTLPSLVSEPAGDAGEILRAGDLGLIADEGAPAVPVRRFALALPPGATATASILDADRERTAEYAVAPVPAVDREGNAEYRRDERFFGRLYPENEIEVSAPARLRDQWIVGVTIHPVRYDGTTGSTVVLRSATVRVSFSGGRSAAAAPPAADAFEPVYRTALLNYRSSASWRERIEAPRKATADGFASSENWIKMEIDERGFYAVGYDDLVGAGLLDPRSAIGDARTLRVFAGNGLALPEVETAARPDWMTEVAIRVVGEEDGSFDSGDRIEFFALPSSGWAGEFVPDTTDYYAHFDHPYAWRHAYWITWGGTFAGSPARMATTAAGAGSVIGEPVTLETFYDRVHEEQDLIRDLTRYGEDGWFWDKYTQTENDKSFYLQVFDADTSAQADVKLRFYDYADATNECGTERVRVRVNGGVQSDVHEWNSCLKECDSTYTDTSGTVFCVRTHITYHDYDSRDDSTITFHPVEGLYAAGGWNQVNAIMSFRMKAYLAWIEFGFRRFFRAHDGALRFRLADPGTYRVPISGFTAGTVRLFDTTDPFGVKELTGLSVSGDSTVAYVEPASPTTYDAVDTGAWRKPASIATYDAADLRDPAMGAQYLVVAYDDFAPSLVPLVSHRMQDYSVRVIKISDIWNQFSWGVRDGVALRDFLAYAYHHWNERPVFVLIVGDATSDFKGHISSPLTTLIPTFFRIDRNGTDTNTYATDDFFTYLDPITGARDWAPDIAVGRFPVNSSTEANVMARKLVAYEGDPEFGSWRNRFLFLADDEIKGGTATGFDCSFLLQHTQDTESVSRTIPETYDRDKVYLVEYPLTSASLKPLATSAYIREIQKGFLLSNYLGHGGFDKMADEELLVAANVKPDILNNGRRLHVFTAFSCSIGSFDLQEANSIAENLIKMDGGGAIASFSSDAPAFAGVSYALNSSFLGHLLPRGHETAPLGMAALAAKAESGGSRSGRKINDEKYTVLGDPALMLGVPELRVRFDEGAVVSFQRGRADTLYGEVLDENGAVATWFHGEADVTIFGMSDTLGYAFLDTACTGSDSNPKVLSTRFRLHGPTFYRGMADVTAGRFQAPFFVPLDTRVGTLGRASAYVVDPSAARDGSGGDDSVRVIAEPTGFVPEDVTGPVVDFTVNGAKMRNGMSFDKNAVFRVALQDTSGINLQQNDDFYSIHLVFDRGRPVDLTSFFEYTRGSFRKGEFTFRLADLTTLFVQEGSHELSFRASDNLNNRTELDYQVFIVSTGEQLSFRSPVLNYPNPFDPDRAGETEILVDLTSNARVTIQILTLTGRRIREIETSTLERGLSIRYPWDGRDQDGDDIANGVYLVRVVAESEDGSARVEEIGKVVILRGGG